MPCKLSKLDALLHKNTRCGSLAEEGVERNLKKGVGNIGALCKIRVLGTLCQVGSKDFFLILHIERGQEIYENYIKKL